MSFDKCTLQVFGRLTRNPERTVFSAGNVSVVRFGIAFAGDRRKNSQTGQWEDEPCFLDCEIFQFENGSKTADVAMDQLKKGDQVYLVGSLKMEQWQDRQTGQQRTKHVFKVADVTFVSYDKNKKGTGGKGQPAQQGRGRSQQQQRQQRPPADDYADAPDDGYDNNSSSWNDDQIPF
jgi:single-strand DNA-binding protein